MAAAMLEGGLYGALGGAGTFECGLRVVEGNILGLSSHWRHGVGSVNGNELAWRRIPSSTTLTLRIVSLDRLRMRSAQGRERISRSPKSVAIPARVHDGAQIEIAVLRREVERFLDLLGAPGVLVGSSAVLSGCLLMMRRAP